MKGFHVCIWVLSCTSLREENGILWVTTLAFYGTNASSTDSPHLRCCGLNGACKCSRPCLYLLKLFLLKPQAHAFPWWHAFMDGWNDGTSRILPRKRSRCNPFLSQDMAFSLNTIPVHTLSRMLPLWCTCTCFMYNTIRTRQMSISEPDWTAYCYILPVVYVEFCPVCLPLGVASVTSLKHYL